MIERPVTLAASIVFSLVTLAPFASGVDEATKRAALLLGYESLDLLYSLETCEGLSDSEDATSCRFSSDNAESRLNIADYVRTLRLTVSYPEDPIGPGKDAVPLARYGQTVLAELDEVHEAAFVVGWYGRIAERLTGQDSLDAAHESAAEIISLGWRKFS